MPKAPKTSKTHKPPKYRKVAPYTRPDHVCLPSEKDFNSSAKPPPFICRTCKRHASPPEPETIRWMPLIEKAFICNYPEIQKMKDPEIWAFLGKHWKYLTGAPRNNQTSLSGALSCGHSGKKGYKCFLTKSGRYFMLKEPLKPSIYLNPPPASNSPSSPPLSLDASSSRSSSPLSLLSVSDDEASSTTLVRETGGPPDWNPPKDDYELHHRFEALIREIKQWSNLASTTETTLRTRLTYADNPPSKRLAKCILTGIHVTLFVRGGRQLLKILLKKRTLKKRRQQLRDYLQNVDRTPRNDIIQLIVKEIRNLWQILDIALLSSTQLENLLHEFLLMYLWLRVEGYTLCMPLPADDVRKALRDCLPSSLFNAINYTYEGSAQMDERRMKADDTEGQYALSVSPWIVKKGTKTVICKAEAITYPSLTRDL